MDLGNYTNWKIYNNALESFNNVIKRCCTLHASHSLSALVDLFMERLVFDISMDIKDLRKCYKLNYLPSVEVKQKSEAIDESNLSSGKRQMYLLLIINMVMLKSIA